MHEPQPEITCQIKSPTAPYASYMIEELTNDHHDLINTITKKGVGKWAAKYCM